MAASPIDRVVFLETWRATAEEAGRAYGQEFYELPPSEWHAAMADEAKYRSYGTLVCLVGKVHEDLTQEPVHARELSAVILAFVDEVETPDPLYRDLLRGLAWKERANALKVTGDMTLALQAAERAVAILSVHPSHLHACAKADLVIAQILQQTGRSDDAITTARRCAVTFKAHGDTTYYGHARMTEAWVLFSRRQVREAMQIFVDRVREAEEDGDKLHLAQALQCTGVCARELGDIVAARTFFARSLTHYEQFGRSMAADVPKVRWSYALSLAAEGREDEAIPELEKVEAEFLRLGMNTEAANAAVESVRMRFERDEDVTRRCSQIVMTFANAGMAQNALEPLAYLREQARKGQLSIEKLEKARKFFRELPKNPRLQFARLQDS